MLYEGEFKNNEMHGRGTLTYPDGSVHLNAEWANGQRVGSEGEFRFRAGHTYTGNWAHSTFNDAGCFTYAEGDKYDGTWKQFHPSRMYSSNESSRSWITSR